ncbi:Hypothetical protein A7982_10461 [Minicystis rosea]|nr:Hypothetical protein A7982_10461 [Minicystis rosea]
MVRTPLYRVRRSAGEEESRRGGDRSPLGPGAALSWCLPR